MAVRGWRTMATLPWARLVHVTLTGRTAQVYACFCVRRGVEQSGSSSGS